MDSRSRNAAVAATVGIGAMLAAAALVRRARQYDLRGKVALVTGASRGLGLVLARELAREGACLVICARDPEELERARGELAAAGAEVLAVPCDVTSRAQVDNLAAAAVQRFGRVDVLVNNAGMIQVGPMEVMTLEDYEAAMKIHFWAPLFTTLALLPQMKERGEGRIVNISSIGGKIAVPHLLPYCASKFALVGFSEGLRAELAKDGISVTTVCPGLMRTGSPVNAFFKGRHREEYAWFTIGDSLPGTSISADKAARQIVSACKRGEAEIVLSLPAQLAVMFHGVFPGPVADLLGAVNQLLPAPGGIGSERARGHDSESPVTRSFLTLLTRRAAQENNQAA
jgi:NAD(P)-dependent dehydrogenase (short-subunit alcohol dehydrogenase family)